MSGLTEPLGSRAQPTVAKPGSLSLATPTASPVLNAPASGTQLQMQQNKLSLVLHPSSVPAMMAPSAATLPTGAAPSSLSPGPQGSSTSIQAATQPPIQTYG